MPKRKSPSGAKREHPDHGELLPKLNRAQGQLEGTKRMITERRYCPEIIQQLRAARKALVSIEASLLERHLRECVAEAIDSKAKSHLNEKIDVIMRIFRSGSENGIELKGKDLAND